MKSEITQNDILNYYNQSAIDYILKWDLASSLAMHFGFWTDSVKSLRQALKKENQVLAKIAQIKKSDAVLDAGCGIGGSAIYLAKNIGCEVTGINIVTKHIEKAYRLSRRKRLADKTRFVVMDFQKLEFPGESFDVVWAVESFCHAGDKDKFIREAFRVLRKNENFGFIQ